MLDFKIFSEDMLKVFDQSVSSAESAKKTHVYPPGQG